MDFFRSMFGGRNNGKGDRNNDTHYDEFLDPRSGFWGDEYKQMPNTPSPHNDPDNSHRPSFFPAFGWTFGTDSGAGGIDDEINTHFNQMFQDIGRIFGQFDRTIEFEVPSEPPSIGQPPHGPHEPPQNPRDYLLKKPDSDSNKPPPVKIEPEDPKQPCDAPQPPVWQPQFSPSLGHSQPKVDRDLDGTNVNIDELFAPKQTLPCPPSSHPHDDQQLQPYQPSQPFFRGFSKSVRSYTSSDGSQKTEVITRDHAGNEERQVTETKDGQTTTVTSRKTKDGQTQITENQGEGVQSPALENSDASTKRMFKWIW